MLIRQLEYVVAVAREGHFGRAAASCWVSTPTLSDGISRLEAELGVILIRRSRRYEGLTLEGEKLVGWARRMLNEQAELLAELSGPREQLAGRLRIGAIPTALPPVPLITDALTRRWPEVVIDVQSMAAHEITDKLAAFELDAGLSYVDDVAAFASNLRVIRLYRECHVVVTPRGGPLGRHASASWFDVAQQPLCLLSANLQNRQIIDRRFQREGIAVSPGVETDSLTVLGGYLRSGQWTSVVPRTWVHLFGLPERMRVVPLSGDPVCATVGLLVRTGQPTPRLVTALTDTVAAKDLQQALDNPALVG